MFNMFRALDALVKIVQETEEQQKFWEKKRNAAWSAWYKLRLEHDELQCICNMRENDLSIVSSYSIGKRKG